MSPKPFIHEDFLLDTRSACKLYHEYAEPQPIIDYHCHLPPSEIASDKRWKNIVEVWLGGDHYKWRQLRWNGFPEALCSGLVGNATAFERFMAYAEALERLEVDYLGLDRIDRRILSTIIQNYAGGPVGLDTLAAAVGEESVTLEDVYEPYLMQIGFLTRTPRGRCVTRLAYNHLHLEAPDGVPDAQMTLSF